MELILAVAPRFPLIRANRAAIRGATALVPPTTILPVRWVYTEYPVLGSALAEKSGTPRFNPGTIDVCHTGMG